MSDSPLPEGHRKITVVNIATPDTMFSVVGKRAMIREYIVNNPQEEYLNFKVLHAEMGEVDFDILNKPRQINIIGTEYEIEVDEHNRMVKKAIDPNDTANRQTHVTLGAE